VVKEKLYKRPRGGRQLATEVESASKETEN